MSFTRNGGWAALFAVIAIGLSVFALLPKTFWVETSGTVTIAGQSQILKIESSLWRTCNTTTPVGDSSAASQHSCGPIRKIDISADNFKTEVTAEKDGAAAGLVLAGIFCLFSFFGLCCRSKCALVTLLLIAVIFAAAAVGCYARYKVVSLDDNYKLQYGFGVACGAFAATFFALIGSCCFRRDADYEILA